MATKETVTQAVLELLAALTKKDVEELSENLDADFEKDYHFTSLEYFPLLSGLEEKLDAELDYADFLTNVHTVNQAIDYTVKVLE